MEIIARLITIVSLLFGFMLGAIAGHYEGQSSVYARMVGQTADLMSQLKVGK